MDIYQIIETHNRPWTEREMLAFSVIVVITVLVLAWLVYQKKIGLRQAVAGLFLLLFAGIVYGSTVFTRSVTEYQYKLVPLWSWYEVFVRHSREMLKENILNMLLLLPAGFLLPFVLDRKTGWKEGFFAGGLMSASIECMQLVFRRGLFEWDDILHNSIGCMAGCLLGNILFELWEKRRGKGRMGKNGKQK